jgi:CelD/BcsL family acetyltransferase involved in cellulose biosynthesis
MTRALTRPQEISAAGPDLTIKTSLAGWATQWDDLVQASALPSPFLRSWWLLGAGARDPVFVLVVDGEQLLGGIALDRGRVLGLPALRMMGGGQLCADHLDLLAREGSADRVATMIRQWLLRPGERTLDFDGLRPDGLLAGALAGQSRLNPVGRAPWTALPETSSAYVQARPRTLRKTIARTSARLTEEGVRHRICRGESVSDSLAALRRLHAAQWGTSSRFLPVFDRFARACALGAEAGEVAVHELRAGQDVISCMAAFEVAGRVSLYQSARRTEPRWRDATIMLISAIISDACERGLAEVDFLRGEETYKDGFAPERRPVVRLRAATGRATRLVLDAELAARRAKGLLAARYPGKRGAGR